MDFDMIDLQWFAAEDEGRTEEPTETKLRKAREEGRIPKSHELSSAIVLLVTVVTLIVAAPFYLRWCVEILKFYFTRVAEKSFVQPGFFHVFIFSMMKMVLPLAITGIVAGVTANIIQNKGFLYTTKTIEPQFSKIVPKFGQYLKKTLFSFEGTFNVLKSLFKVASVSLTAYIIIRMNVPVILKLIQTASVYGAVARIASATATILVSCAFIFIVIAIPDYFVQKKQFLESMKMSKEELKQEFKEQEGDPEVKAHLAKAQRDLLQMDIPAQVEKSDVVITNPTHYAVALYYDRGVTESAPKVMAKGVDVLALRIKSIAKEKNVPVVENRPLARTLYSECEIGDIIPENLFTAVSTIYSQLRKFNKNK